MKTISLNLYREALLFDIQNDSHLLSQSQSSQGVESRKAFNLQISAADDATKNKILRGIEHAVSSLKSAMGQFVEHVEVITTSVEASGTAGQDEYVPAVTANNLADNKLPTATTGKIQIILDVSSDFNESFIKPLTDHASQFVSNKVLFDWYTITFPDFAKVYIELAKAAIVEMRECFHKNSPTAPASYAE